MKCFAKAHGGVSVVGDPDQSIYSWRAAEVENLNKMNDSELSTARLFPKHKLTIRLSRSQSDLSGGKLPLDRLYPLCGTFGRDPRYAATQSPSGGC